ncbi:NERD domain-containing protein [Aestuariimicrobium sp. Y1814]|uniref:nuclease-related domain-containing DEAD/DEAH box helicase n=1 Tax=Aestuariimicrobium sp. Y1814 TaxID=3418742 RepID=UPI003DA6D09F
MAARSIPAEPRFTTGSEADVWRRLFRQLDGCTILPNFRLTDRDKDHEVDLVALMPGSGIVTIEVKGSHVWHDGGNWRISRDQGSEVVHPVDQARDACYALRHYVEADPRWGSRGRLRWSHHVVLANTHLGEDFQLPDCPRWQVSGSSDLENLGERVWDTTSLHRRDARVPTAEDIEVVCDILAGRSLPAADPVALADDRRTLADRLTMEQANLLSVIRLVPRVEVRGGAGSGKTVLAQRQASDLASGRLTGTRQKVAVVCYSYGLAKHLKRELEVGSRKHRPAFVGSFEDLARRWGVRVDGNRLDSDYWEQRLPALMLAAAAGLAEDQLFDSIIIDESQDFATDWWHVLVAGLRDPEQGGLYAYTDERQRVFERFGRPPIALVPLVLDHNLRNTRQIGASFVPLAPTSMQLRGPEGPEVTFVAAGPDEALDVADDQVEELLNEGWRPGDIALLTTGRRHPVQAERQESLGFNDYWDDFWSDEDVFYSHVLGFKGLERKAVVLCINEDGSRDRGRERLYVGLSRASDRLVVVGDREVIARMGGAEAADALVGP